MSRGPTSENYIRRQTLNARRRRVEPAPIEVARPKDVPPPPKELKGEARHEWERCAPELHAANLLGTIDLGLLRDYCTLIPLLRAVHSDIEKRGAIIDERRGTLNPNCKIWLRLMQQLLRMREQLGMTAMSRARLAGKIAAPSREKDEFDRFLDDDEPGGDLN
jgi:P27 family predicted phage terminase small subunit